MRKYSDKEILEMNNITTKIAGDYLGVAPMSVAIGLREEKLPIGYAIKRSNRWSYHIVANRLVAYKNGNLQDIMLNSLEDKLDKIIDSFSSFKNDLLQILKEVIK